MISAVCPDCSILLVQFQQPSDQDLRASAATAAMLGAVAISISWGGPEAATARRPAASSRRRGIWSSRRPATPGTTDPHGRELAELPRLGHGRPRHRWHHAVGGRATRSSGTTGRRSAPPAAAAAPSSRCRPSSRRSARATSGPARCATPPTCRRRPSPRSRRRDRRVHQPASAAGAW